MMFKIPIEQYEKDFDENLSKETKEEIINLLTKSNKLRSEKEFREIEELMHEACKLGDVDLIKFYLSESIEDSTKDLMFKIDTTSKTASLFKVNSNIKQLIVPRTVQHESTEYLITSITGTHQDIKTIKFVEDSAVTTIYFGAISKSEIEEIYFPSSLRELREKWCHEACNLKKITISPLNDQFIFKDDKYLFGKTDPNNDEFDNLLFACHDIRKISIPSNVKIISPYSLSICRLLKIVEITPNSNLQIIGSFAFLQSAIKEIFIPPKVTKICKSAFEYCTSLVKIDIPPNSNLRTIESNAFNATKIEEIYFPTSLTELKEGWCYGTKNLKKITISPSNYQFKYFDYKYLLGKSDSNTDKFDILLFVRRDIKKFSIPSNIKIISSCTFMSCDDLTQVGIPINSNLQIIEKLAFSGSKIEEIYFPNNLRELKEGWCCLTSKLRKIIISPSNDQFISINGKYVLGKSDLSKNEFDNLIFANRDIDKISIPSNIKIISSFSFHNCINLKKVEIPPNSNLEIIGSFAFSQSKIEDIFISSKIKKICNSAFNFNTCLSKVEIAENSNLQTIETLAFVFCNIGSFFIPSNVSIIGKGAFGCCINLQIVEISEKSIMRSLLLSIFSKDSIIIGKIDSYS